MLGKQHYVILYKDNKTCDMIRITFNKDESFEPYPIFQSDTSWKSGHSVVLNFIVLKYDSQQSDNIKRKYKEVVIVENLVQTGKPTCWKISYIRSLGW